MDASNFYRAVAGRLCQGDLFERLPVIHLKGTLPRKLKGTTLAAGRQGYSADEELGTQPGSFEVPAACDYSSAILLSYDCEIDKPNVKSMTVALVRPLDAGIPSDSQNIIRQNRNAAYFHLPPGPDFGERYVDFRRVATLSVEIVNGGKRLASLTDEAWKALQFQLVRYLTRFDLNTDLLKRPT